MTAKICIPPDYRRESAWTTSFPSHTEIIGTLNDRCRQGLDRRARIVITRSCLATFAEAGVSTLVAQTEIMAALRAHTFDSDDRERNRGAFELRGHTVYFAIDYYDEVRPSDRDGVPRRVRGAARACAIGRRATQAGDG
ncbi:hypothetical protein [Sphingomonas sp. BK235]|uniref:hypothetical protein n=1 Tax=Sphingomonas sp. BK235 TaxID=2512131 RepID=UPI001404F9FB|nr:hypothetical protein [Sphingomonas sp. BK235]